MLIRCCICEAVKYFTTVWLCLVINLHHFYLFDLVGSSTDTNMCPLEHSNAIGINSHRLGFSSASILPKKESTGAAVWFFFTHLPVCLLFARALPPAFCSSPHPYALPKLPPVPLFSFSGPSLPSPPIISGVMPASLSLALTLALGGCSWLDCSRRWQSSGQLWMRASRSWKSRWEADGASVLTKGLAYNT